MNDRQVIEYLRSRGRAQPPMDFVQSVMTAIDRAPAPRSRFSAYLPAFVAAGAVAVVALLALLIGPGRDVGPAPSPSGTPAPTAELATLAELESAVSAATARLASAPAVHGTHTYTLGGYLASATWFDWRPTGDEVVVTRTDIDVSAPWWTDPDGEPLSVGQRIETDMWVIVGNTAHASREDSWLALNRDDAPQVLHWGTGMLSGAIPPAGGIDRVSERAVSRRTLAGGAELWALETSRDDARSVTEWRIGPDGVLTSFTVAGDAAALEPGLAAPTAARAVIEFTPVTDPEPIPTPDPGAVPDPSPFGLPADFPLGDDAAAAIDYRTYVEDALDALEAYHWGSANIDWSAARSAAREGLPDDPPMDQAHARIQRAIETFDFFNTAFVRPADVPPGAGSGGGPGAGALPASERLGDFGVVVLPSAPADGTDALTEYLRAARMGDCRGPGGGMRLDRRSARA